MPLDRPRASVIVCTYDESRLNDLDECVRSILAQKFDDFEVVIVVDHNEGLYRALTNRYRHQRIGVILNSSEVGQAASMNCGVAYAKGKIICFIDDDAVADRNWLISLMNKYDSDTYAVGGRIDPLWVCEKPNYLPEEFYWMVGATGCYMQNEVKEVRNLWSGNISFRKEVFDRIGLYSSNLGKAGDSLFQGEDAEFGLRLLETIGRGVKYVPTAIVHHKVYRDRIGLRSLLKRAYDQGYAKAYIKRFHRNIDALSMERYYLKLLLKTNLRRFKHIVFGPDSINALKQLTFALVSTTMVFLGFIDGLVRARP